METMYDYIYQEKDVFDKVIKNYKYDIKEDFNRILIVGCGSSLNAGKITEPIAIDLGLSIMCYHPVEFISILDNVRKDDLVIFISQVGNSALVVKAMEKVLGKCITVGVTADNTSTIATRADYCIDIECGKEEWNCKCKGMSSTTLCLILFVLNAALKKGNIDEAYYQKELKDIIDITSRIDEYTKQIEKKLPVYLDAVNHDNNYWFLSCNYNYQVCREFAMKIIESAHVKSSYKEIEEFLHGYEMGVDNNDAFLIIAFDDISYDYGRGLKHFLIDNKMTDKVCLVSCYDEGDVILDIPRNKYNIFIGLAFLQMACFKLSQKYGIDSKEVVYKNINNYIQTKL